MENEKYINIIYFDSFGDTKEILSNLNAFKKRTNGAFIFCRTINRFRALMEEIKSKSRSNSTKNIFFHLIVSGSNSEKALEAIDEYEAKQNIKKICIYCFEPKIYIDKYQNNDYIEKSNITRKKLNAIRFIEKNKSEEISSLKEEFNNEEENIFIEPNDDMNIFL